MTGPQQAPDRPGEFDVIARYFAPLATEPGAFGLLDDAARIAAEPGLDLVITKDTLAAGVHFFADDRPGDIASKALRVNLSDLAAKGATPRHYLLSLALPADWTEDWLGGFAQGLASDQRRYRVSLLGGDTLKSPAGLVISVTAIGVVETGAMVTRLGGRAGDRLYVSGSLGDAAFGLALRGSASATADWPLDRADRDHLIGRYLLPQPRLELAGAVRDHARAAMDVSDGLLGDLEKLCRASGLGAIVRVDRVPFSPPVRALLAGRADLRGTALNGGDDYEILCSVAADRAGEFEGAAAAAGVAVTDIGELTKSCRGVSVIDEGGATVPIPDGAYVHF